MSPTKLRSGAIEDTLKFIGRDELHRRLSQLLGAVPLEGHSGRGSGAVRALAQLLAYRLACPQGTPDGRGPRAASQLRGCLYGLHAQAVTDQIAAPGPTAPAAQMPLAGAVHGTSSRWVGR
ncbi:MAG: hypothetical protein U5R31_16885 [Acidimicrobiia bacterium]|nr:hypothetical protein [Acidimicrobiia bacterium]